MSIFTYYECRFCEALYRGPANKPSRCPRCHTDTPPKIFHGDPADRLPPCTEELRARP
jgi:hypothetical protein